MAKLGATSGQLPAFRFRVSLGGLELGFNSVSGLQQETEEILYRHGDEETRQHKLRGLTTFQDITLQQGLLLDDKLMKEALTVFNIEDGKNNQSNYVFDEVTIAQLDMSGNEVLKWKLEGAWISSFSLDDYDSNSSAIQFLSVTLKVEGIKFEKLA